MICDGDINGDDDGDGDLPVNDTNNGVVNIDVYDRRVTISARHKESIIYCHNHSHLRNIVMPKRAASALVSLCTLRISLQKKIEVKTRKMK